jgi:hypothetical protein
MTGDGAPRRRLLGYILGCLAAVAAALAAWAIVTGGFRTYLGPVPLSVRGAFRPTLAAVVLGIVSLHLLGAWRWTMWSRAAARLPLAPPLIAIAAAVAVLIAGAVYGTKAAGGSDVYGYVSQATLWMKGTLVLRQDFIASIPWPNAAWSFSPLGYRPADFEHTIMPTYAPGTALLMALMQALVGHCGPYLVGPICAAALVLLTYRLGVRVSNPVVGLIAACCIATSPTVLFMANWPMSDVPTAAFWMAALVAATRRGLVFALLSGAASGIAITIRPNLAPLAIVPAAWLVVQPSVDWRRRMRDVAAFAAACAPFILFIAWLFNRLYGSPLRSGYGDLSDLYAWSNVPSNVMLYFGWFLETQGPLAVLAFAAPVTLVWTRGEQSRLRVLLIAFALLLVAMYLVYAPFDFWTYLRFLLPAFPVAFILAADLVSVVSGRFGPVAHGVTLLLFAVGTAGYGASQADGRNVLTLGESEQKFADVGQYVARTLPENAVVVAQQHGGSVRFYGNRLTLRFDILDPDWLDRSLVHLRQAGYMPYFLLEQWELPQFRERFAGQRALALLDRQPMAVTLDGVVRLYSTGDESASEPAVIPKTTGCVEPHPAFGMPR